jgi:uncharacterized protein
MTTKHPSAIILLMKYTEAKPGRIFILRLEDMDRIPDVIENFANEKEIKSATVQFLGGSKKNSKIVVGPEDCEAETINPIVTTLKNTSESMGVGTIFTNEAGEPKLHMHSAFGSKKTTVTGCTRTGVNIWLIGEVIITELITTASRKIDPKSGFELLSV